MISFSVHCKPDVSPETAKALADMLLHAVAVTTPDPVIDALREAKERAERDLLAVGHATVCAERTAAMIDLRNWIARLNKLLGADDCERVTTTCTHCDNVTSFPVDGDDSKWRAD